MNSEIINIEAPAKINLHLEIICKRNDGYHELAMVMQSINLSDYLEIKNNNISTIRLSSNKKELSDGDDNLIIKAAKLIKNYSNNPKLGADIYLEKNIPIGAGLAGGSTDAAAALIGLNELWNLSLNSRELHRIGAMLGSDVPFCIDGGTQYCFGRGDVLEKFETYSDYSILLLKNPKTSLSTSDVYKKYSEQFKISSSLDNYEINLRKNALRRMGFNKSSYFRNTLKIRNDLQKIAENESTSVGNAIEILSKLKNKLSYSMSGSGPSCYAIFENSNLARSCYEENKKTITEGNFDAWICGFRNNGVSIL